MSDSKSVDAVRTELEVAPAITAAVEEWNVHHRLALLRIFADPTLNPHILSKQKSADLESSYGRISKLLSQLDSVLVQNKNSGATSHISISWKNIDMSVERIRSLWTRLKMMYDTKSSIETENFSVEPCTRIERKSDIDFNSCKDPSLDEVDLLRVAMKNELLSSDRLQHKTAASHVEHGLKRRNRIESETGFELKEEISHISAEVVLHNQVIRDGRGEKNRLKTKIRRKCRPEEDAFVPTGDPKHTGILKAQKTIEKKRLAELEAMWKLQCMENRVTLKSIVERAKKLLEEIDQSIVKS